MSEYLCRSCERSVLFNGGAYCRHFQCVKGIVTGCTAYKQIEQEAPPPPLNTRRCLFTNADRLRSMTDEELAVVIAWPYLASPPWCSEHTTCPYISEDPTPCDKCALDWLKQEAKNG